MIEQLTKDGKHVAYYKSEIVCMGWIIGYYKKHKIPMPSYRPMVRKLKNALEKNKSYCGYKWRRI